MRSTKSANFSLLHFGIIGNTCLFLCSCGTSMDQDYFKMQKWESSFLASKQALHKHQIRYARSMAAEAVSAARAFGNENFRLALSLSQLADVEKASGKVLSAEKSYKQAVAILKQLEEKATKPSFDANKSNRGVEGSNGLQKHQAMEDLADCLNHMGSFYLKENKIGESLECFKSASKKYQFIFADTSSNPRDSIAGQKLSQTLLLLAEAAAKSDNLELAKQSYQQALIAAAAAKSPEFVLHDIRDEALRFLQEAGEQSAASSLASDRLFGQYSADGHLAISERDFTTAEIQFRKAFQEAKNSILSERRILRSLSNLVAVFCREGKTAELDKCSKLADTFMRDHQIPYDRDYDELLDTIASFDFISGRYADAVKMLDKQLAPRIVHFGQDSKEVCATMALKGRAEYKLGNLQAAQSSALATYRLLKKKYMTDRRCSVAIGITADLLSELKQFEPAEELTRRLVEIKMTVKDPADSDVIAMQTQLFALYHKFNNKDKAARTIDEIVHALDKGNSVQRAASFPYLVIILSYCTAVGWYEQAEPIAKLGQSIMHKELANSNLDEVSRVNWIKDIALMREHLGKPF